MKHLHLIRKKLLPLFISAVVMASQIPVVAADFSDAEIEAGEDSTMQENTAEDWNQQSEESGETDTDIYGEDISGAVSESSESIQQESSEENEEISLQGSETDDTATEIEQFSLEQTDPFSDGETEFDSEDTGIEYIKGRPLTEEEEKEQLAPFDRLTSYSTAIEIGNDTGEIPMGRAAAYPSYYNAAEQGYVTSVKNQDPYGMCWAFGMASLMETSLLSQGLGTYDLSEEHLAYFWANRSNDPLGNTAGDINRHYGTDDYGNVDYHEGGNDLLASMFLSTWSGMTTEADVPLATDSTHTQKTGAIPARSKEFHSSAYLKNSYFSDYSVSAMKKLLTANHSVSIMYNAQNRYYNASTAAYSYPTSTKSVNHVVTVVGWDDNYSASNFAAASRVTSDGAWIVKNSWGTDWGKDGYFYMSYEDKSVCELVAVTVAAKPEYGNNYFYDGTSGLASIKMYSGEKFASIFKASAGKGKAESLGEVALASMTANSSFTVQVYTNLKDASDPTSGTPAYAQPISCVQSMAGIETFKIPEVLISQNSLYSVVITNAGSKTLKYYVEASVDYTWCKFEASVSAGQSFIYYPEDTGWMDAKEYSPSITPRIKAHTRTLNSAAKMTLSASSLSMNAGDKKTLKASATRAEMTSSGITWTSSDKNIATVSTKGVITAKKPGTVTISCYGNNAKGIKASCKVTVKLKKTAGVKISGKSYNKINIAWSAVSGCNRYVVYRSQNGGKEKKLTTVKANVKTWQDTAVKTGNTYTYRVRAAYVISGKTTVYGGYSDKVSAKAEPGKATAKASAKIGPYNMVSWNKVSGAGGYRIYRKVKGQNWKCIKEVKSMVLSYKDSSVQGITTYAYAVRAYRTVGGKKILGGYKASSYIQSYPLKQKISKICKTSSGLKIYWSTQKKASGYQIYRKTKNSSWKKIKTISNGKTASFEDRTAKKGTTYYYAVRAGAKTSTGKTVYGSYTAKTAKR